MAPCKRSQPGETSHGIGQQSHHRRQPRTRSGDALHAQRRSGHQHRGRDDRKLEGQDSGEKKELTEWHRITFYRKLAEIAGQYLKKGSQIYVEGRLQTRKWTDKENVERYTTEIIADSMQMLGSRQGMGGGSGAPMDDDYAASAPAPRQSSGGGGGGGGGRDAGGNGGSARQPAKPAPNFNDMDDDIPF